MHKFESCLEDITCDLQRICTRSKALPGAFAAAASGAAVHSAGFIEQETQIFKALLVERSVYLQRTIKGLRSKQSLDETAKTHPSWFTSLLRWATNAPTVSQLRLAIDDANQEKNALMELLAADPEIYSVNTIMSFQNIVVTLTKEVSSVIRSPRVLQAAPEMFDSFMQAFFMLDFLSSSSLLRRHLKLLFDLKLLGLPVNLAGTENASAKPSYMNWFARNQVTKPTSTAPFPFPSLSPSYLSPSGCPSSITLTSTSAVDLAGVDNNSPGEAEDKATVQVDFEAMRNNLPHDVVPDAPTLSTLAFVVWLQLITQHMRSCYNVMLMRIHYASGVPFRLEVIEAPYLSERMPPLWQVFQNAFGVDADTNLRRFIKVAGLEQVEKVTYSEGCHKGGYLLQLRDGTFTGQMHGEALLTSMIAKLEATGPLDDSTRQIVSFRSPTAVLQIIKNLFSSYMLPICWESPCIQVAQYATGCSRSSRTVVIYLTSVVLIKSIALASFPGGSPTTRSIAPTNKWSKIFGTLWRGPQVQT